MDRYRDILRLKDSHSKVVRKVIDIIGFDTMNSYQLNTIEDFYVVVNGLLNT